MEKADLNHAVALAYEAATGGCDWFEFGTALCGLVGAQVASLRLLDGSWTNLLQPISEADRAYLAYYSRIDPYRARQGNEIAGSPPLNRAVLQQEILSTSELHRTEYFNAYARPNGQHHMLGALVEFGSCMPLGLHRNSTGGAFTESERQTLNVLLPHLRRALQLQNRLDAAAKSKAASLAALDALSLCVFVVDATMTLQYVNSAAEDLTARSRSGLRLIGAGPNRMHLAAHDRKDDEALRRFVLDAAAGGSGGALRLRMANDAMQASTVLAILVSPLPTRLAPSTIHQSHPSLVASNAMVVAQNLSRTPRVLPIVLRNLYGLTQAEAAVGLSLAGGATAESVAQSRKVSVETVRSQVRAVLRKTEAINLRDLQRLLTLVAIP